jgi:predicted component of type VI protein secretion system
VDFCDLGHGMGLKISGNNTESASRPLMDFGKLNNNMIKGLTYLLKNY